PRRAAIGRAIDTASPARAVAVVRFAGAEPDHFWIRGCYGDRAHRRDILVVGDARERRAVVGGLHETAVRGGGIERRWRLGIERDVGNASAHHGWPDAARAEAFEQRFRDGRGGIRG